MSSFNNDVVNIIQSMVNIFQKNKHEKNISCRIERGRAPSASADFENLFAKFIENQTNDNIRIFVDFAFRYKPYRKHKSSTKTMYPDITLVRGYSIDGKKQIGGEVIAFVEAKIDLGYLSKDWSKNKNEMIESLRKTKVISNKNKKCTFSINKNFQNLNIILSEENDHGRLEKFKEENDNTFFLISKEHLHPNNDNIDIMKRDYKYGDYINSKYIYIDDYLYSIFNNPRTIEEWGKLKNCFSKISPIK